MHYARMQFVVPAAALLIFVLALAVSFYSLRRDHAEVMGGNKENLSWTAAQAEVEVLRFVTELERYGRADPNTSREEVARRFDILWSRLALFTEGEVGRRLLAFPDAGRRVQEVFAFLRQEEAAILGLRPGDNESLQRIVNSLHSQLDGIHDLTVRIMQSEERRFADLRDHQEDSRAVLQLFTIGAIVSGGLLLLSLARINHKHSQQAQQMTELALEAKAASDAKSQFLAMMSHEVRTPLNGILGMINLLLEGRLEKTQRHYAESARQSSEALFDILNDILDFSRLEAGKLDMEEKVFDLEKQIANIVRLFGPQAAERELFLTYEILTGVPRFIKGDPGRLRQVILNLVGNAIKFTRRGGVSIQVSGRSDGAGTAALTFIVNDTGIGIAPEKQESIFESFAQADARTSRKFGGTGLGLAICKRLVTLMGGQIGCDSEAGVGSTFWFSAVTRIPDSSEILHEMVPGLAEQAPRVMPDVRVLVVEDSPTSLELAVIMLEKLGCRVTAATNGREALQLLAADGFDLVLMDVQMPEMDGFEATARIRAMEGPARDLPIIALTANAMRGDRERCLEAGMSDYLSKPLRRDDLERAVAAWAPAGAPHTGMEEEKAAMTRNEGAAVTLDAGVLRRLAEEAGPEALPRMLNRFLAEMPERLAAIQEGLGEEATADHLAAVERHCHSLKGAAATFGGLQLSTLALEMEQAAKAGDWQACRAGLGGLPQLVEATEAAVATELGRLTGATRHSKPAA